jgi:hypothetical protein
MFLSFSALTSYDEEKKGLRVQLIHASLRDDLLTLLAIM